MTKKTKPIKQSDSITKFLVQLVKELSEKDKIALLNKLITQKRKSKRIKCVMPVNYSIDNKSFTEKILDISLGGVFLETEQNLAIDQEVVLCFSFLELKKPLEIKGKVVWETHLGGKGIKFLNLTQTQQGLLQTALSNIEEL